MKPTWLTTEPCDRRCRLRSPGFKWDENAGNITYSFMPILNHLPPMRRISSCSPPTSSKPSANAPWSRPTSLRGMLRDRVRCGRASTQTKTSDQGFHAVLPIEPGSDGRVGADASMSPEVRHAEALTLWHKIRPNALDIPRAVASLIIVCIRIQLAIGEPEREVAMAMQRTFSCLQLWWWQCDPRLRTDAPPRFAADPGPPRQELHQQPHPFRTSPAVWPMLPPLAHTASVGPGSSDQQVAPERFWREQLRRARRGSYESDPAALGGGGREEEGELSLAGVTFPSPSNQCWPEAVPFLFKHMAMSMLQLPDRIVMLFSEDHEVAVGCA